MNSGEARNASSAHTSRDSLKEVTYLNIAGRLLSVIAIFSSIVIFVAFKNLRKKGNIRIHLNLFVSNLMMDILLVILEINALILTAKEEGEESIFDISTKQPDAYIYVTSNFYFILETLKWYFVLSNTLWMTCEAIYLFYLVHTVWLIKERILLILYMIGWGIPAVIIIIYSPLEFIFQQLPTKDDETEEPSFVFQILIENPIAMSIIINVFFIFVIIFYLVCSTKHFDHPVRMGARAFMILAPLFGIQHFFLPYLPDNQLGRITNALLSSTQGLVISIIYCFATEEVGSEIRGAWQRKSNLFKYGSYTSSHNNSFPRTSTNYYSAAAKSVHQF